MTMIDHALFALNVCLVIIVILFHPRSQLDEPDEHEQHPGNEADNVICPVCGYYCLGKGGFGCIDKPNIFDRKMEE